MIFKPAFLLSVLCSIVFSVPAPALQSSSVPVPVVIWHGLGDRFDAEGLQSLKTDLEGRFAGVFVHIIKVSNDGASDQRASFFGEANVQVALVCDQLRAIPEITDPTLNPSGHFDAIGFSQGGQLLRAVVERCGGKGDLTVRNLITVGSQHMGISAMPPCPPNSSPFSTCRLMHKSIFMNGLYSSFGQHNIIPAQYLRDEARIDEYLANNLFLKDINNERVGDRQAGPLPDAAKVAEDEPEQPEPRNGTYKENFARLNNLVLLRFSEDVTVVPPQTAHFTLPSPYASNCPPPSSPECYLDPVPFSYLPLFAQDYIGLRQLDFENKVHLGVCEGQHMEIREDCWEEIVSWLGEGDGKKGGQVEQASRFKLVVQL